MKWFLLFFLTLSMMFTFFSATAAQGEAPPGAAPNSQSIIQEQNCNWELSVKDSQEYLYTEDNETIKKIVTIDLSAAKKNGADYLGKYTGEAVITVFNALANEEDASPVLFGGHTATTKKFDITFNLQPIGDILLPTWEFSSMPDRVFDAYSTLTYAIKPDKVRGIFADALDLMGLAATPGKDFEIGDELGLLYVDGGYILLSLTNHWQVPAPFVGTLIGVPSGRK